MDNDIVNQHLQNLMLLQHRGQADDGKNRGRFQQARHPEALSVFASQGMLQQLSHQQQQHNNMRLSEFLMTNHSMMSRNQYMGSQMQQTGMDGFPIKVPPNPFIPQTRHQPPNYAPTTLSSSSLNTVSANSLESASLGSLSRLFSMGTIGSGGNISNHLPRNVSGNHRVNSFQRHSQANVGIQNESWSSVPTQRPDLYAENGVLGPWSAASAALLGDLVVSNDKKQKKSKKRPKDRPKRPLSAYNIFFKEERARILEEVGHISSKKAKIGFQNLAKMIGKRWQDLDPDSMKFYKEKAEIDMIRYRDEMITYVAAQKE
eukprot:scaffold746_cov123-Cylindrotheca_fusiformis.AAC.14